LRGVAVGTQHPKREALDVRVPRPRTDGVRRPHEALVLAGLVQQRGAGSVTSWCQGQARRRHGAHRVERLAATEPGHDGEDQPQHGPRHTGE